MAIVLWKCPVCNKETIQVYQKGHDYNYNEKMIMIAKIELYEKCLDHLAGHIQSSTATARDDDE